MVGQIEQERPYFYCRSCHVGLYPLDDALGVVAGRKQLDMQHAAAQLVTEVPYDTAQSLFAALTGMHTVTNQVAEGLTVLDVAPSRQEIERRIASVSAGRLRRPVLVLGIDGAYVPTRPDSARAPCEGRRGTRARRARWRGRWRHRARLARCRAWVSVMLPVSCWRTFQTVAVTSEKLDGGSAHCSSSVSSHWSKRSWSW